MLAAFIIAGVIGWAIWPDIQAAIAAGKVGKLPPKDAAEEQPACTETRMDGPLTICLVRTTGQWSWRAEGEGHDVSGPGPFGSMLAAVVDAWIQLARLPVSYVIAEPRDAIGLRLERDGDVIVIEQAKYINEASQIIAKAIADGDDAKGTVLSVLAVFGHQYNPLRVRIAGGDLDAAAQRYTSAPAAPPAKAKAIMGLP